MSKPNRSTEGDLKASKPTKPPNTTSAKPPVSSDEGTFQNLREKIEGNLKKSYTERKGESQKKRSSKTAHPSAEVGESRGKKRQANGNVKEENAKRLSSVNDDKTTSRSTRNPKAEKDDEVDLEALVKELGGTQEDIDLINGIDSDSELEGLDNGSAPKEPSDGRKGKSLESGMANILKEIAMVKNTYTESDEDGDEIPEKAPKVNGTAKATQNDTNKPEDAEMTIKSAATEIANSKSKKPKLSCPVRPDWFDFTSNINGDAEPKFEVATTTVEQLHTHGRNLLQTENGTFRNSQASSSSQSFYNSVITSGTLSDKISALTLAVQESPLHNMRALESLLALAKKNSRSQTVDVLRALKDLFAQGSILPSDRRLHTFATNPAVRGALGQVKSWRLGDHLPGGMTESQLIAWTFEDWLKERYFEILQVLESWCNDEIEFAKSRATSYVYELLKEKPEQEANLLRLLINKLGDPVKKIASQASYLVMQLLATHPAMKQVVVTAIDTDFMFKPSQSTHGRYYAVVTLNQTALSTQEEGVAGKLLDIYFGLYKILLKPGEQKLSGKPEKIPLNHKRQRKEAAAVSSTEQEDELQEKLTSAILTGVNRAYPYAGADHQKFDEHIDTLFQITHSANFNTSVQAMMLIQQLLSNTSASTDRFYRVLYESLLDPRLAASSKQQLYLNLLHRSLKADLSQKRVKAFAKRILQTLTLQEPSFVCGAFFLLKDLEKTFPSIATMLDSPEDHEEGEESFHDVEENDTHPGRATVTQNNEKDLGAELYDPSKRDPVFANADASCLWDILPYLAHYHPSVSVSADLLVDHKSLPGKPDLSIHTLIHFLDRFVYKNAKLSSGTKMKGSSIMQPMASEDSRAVLVSAQARSKKMPVNSAEFAARNEHDVAAEDIFFHQYFRNLGKAGIKKEKKRKVATEEAGSDDEDEVWEAMLKNGPNLEGLREDSDDDISDMEGFEEAMDNDEVESLGSEIQADEDAPMIDDDESVDIEAGIFDDSDDEISAGEEGTGQSESASEPEFGGLSADEDEDTEKTEKREPSKKTRLKKEERERKKRLKALPTFASAADWAKELENDEDEDMG